ncbi:hypothetical protein ACWDDN_41400 [Streptomyces griseoruber]
MPPTKNTSRTPALAGALAVAVAGGVIALGGAGSAAGGQDTVDGLVKSDSRELSGVKSAFTAAVKASRAVQAPPASAVGDTSKLAAGEPAPMVAATARKKQLSDGVSLLGRYFTPTQAKKEENGLHNAVTAEADPGFRNLGSGASKVVFTRVGVSGATATVQAEVTIWAKFQQKVNGSWATAHPVNVMNYTATLIRNSEGKWLVSSMTGDFAPGEAP